MQHATANERFRRFVANPTLQEFKTLRRLVTEVPTFEDCANDLRCLNLLFQAGDFKEVIRKSHSLADACQLSPNFHYLVGNAAMEMGIDEMVEFHKLASRACMKCLLETGDGSLDEPFETTYLSDQTDILTALGSEVRCRELVETTEGFCDAVTCHDGTEVWFDVDVPLNARRSNKPKQVSTAV